MDLCNICFGMLDKNAIEKEDGTILCVRCAEKEEDYFDEIWVTTPMPLEYTCCCGVYVHPSIRNYKAFHIADCPYAKGRVTE